MRERKAECKVKAETREIEKCRKAAAMGEVSRAVLGIAAVRHWAICGGILSASWTTHGNIGSDMLHILTLGKGQHC